MLLLMHYVSFINLTDTQCISIICVSNELTGDTQ